MSFVLRIFYIPPALPAGVRSYPVENFFWFSLSLRQHLHLRTVIMSIGQLDKGGEAGIKWFIGST